MSKFKAKRWGRRNPERRDLNFTAFFDKVKLKSKQELVEMLFLAVEALAVKDAQISPQEEKKEDAT